MRYVVMPSHNIGMNLATEQYLMNDKDFGREPLVLFYWEEPCIIVGRNQNTLEEINSDYVREHHIRVTRRLSGGGAVYQDMGNLCFSFVVPADSEEFGDFKSFTAPIVKVLHEMGATTAEVSGRNDILVDGKKFSGNAMYTKNGKTFSHGTLMLNVDLSVVAKALHVAKDKIASKGIKSVRSRVTNLRPYLDKKYANLEVPEFVEDLIKGLYDVDSVDQVKDKEYKITEDDQKEIDKIYEKFYNNWDWVYGKSPAFTVKRRKHFDMGTIDARLDVTEGKINNIKFYGDFFGPEDITPLAEALKGVKYDYDSILKVLEDKGTEQYISGIPTEQIAKLLA